MSTAIELVFTPSPDLLPTDPTEAAATDPSPDRPGRRVVVTDLTWSRAPGIREGPGPLRDVIVDALLGRDLLAESLALLDDWGRRAGAIEASTVDGLSGWHDRRLHLWRWLHERLAWLAVLDLLLAEGEVVSIAVPADDAALGQVAGLMGAARGIAVRESSAGPADRSAVPRPSRPAAAAAASASRRDPIARLRRLPARIRLMVRRRQLDRRLARLAAETPRLLVLRSPTDRQVITAGTRNRVLNPFLDPIVEALAGTVLDPITFELTASAADDDAWRMFAGPGSGRTLLGELLATRFAGPDDRAARLEASARAVAALRVALPVAGVDLGPSLAAELATGVRGALAGRLRDMDRIRRFLERLHPAGLLLVNEYGRPEWLAAARAVGVPVAAVQHGIIHRLHVGYVYPSRSDAPDLPGRTYVFGDEEARLLTEGAYRPSEVVVSGSPRLDLAGSSAAVGPADRVAVRASVRRELAIAEGNRLVVLTTTAASVLTRFAVIPSLGRLLDRPLPGVHLVVKLHPGETDGTSYLRLVEGLARAGGFAPPPVTIVRRIDLYRLLAAADAHLGGYSTVLSEAVVTGTPNLLAAVLGSGDLLGYVEAGVARPVRNGSDVLEALGAAEAGRSAEAATGSTETSRATFLAAHYRPGPAASRIADDLLDWLPPR